MQLPIGSEDKFKAIVDLIALKLMLLRAENCGNEIPADLKDKVDEYRAMLVEAASKATTTCWQSSLKINLLLRKKSRAV